MEDARTTFIIELSNSLIYRQSRPFEQKLLSFYTQLTLYKRNYAFGFAPTGENIQACCMLDDRD